MAELTLEENIRQILPTLPLPIQKFFQQGKLGEIAQLLMERYALHVDQGTVLERELMFMLLGLKSPDEFAAEIYEQLPISEQTVQDMLADINQEVFIPLREEEMKPAPPAAWKESAPPAPRPAPVNAGVPSYVYAKPKQSSPQYFHLENKIPPPQSLREGRLTSLNPQKLLAEEKLLEDHEEPHIELNELKKALEQVVPEQVSTLRMAEVRQVNKAEVPANLPGVVIPPTPVVPATPIVKSYSADPYREPIDES